MESVKDIIKTKDDFVEDLKNRHKYVTKEYQDYGYRIALKLGQKDKASLYIKLAKEKPRVWLDQAFSFAIDYPNAKNRGKLFMWKLHDLEKVHKEGKKESENDSSSEKISKKESSERPKNQKKQVKNANRKE